MIASRTATDPRIPGHAPVSAGVRAEARSWARTTPGWLRLSSVSLAVLIVIASLLAVFVTASRQAATNRARSTAGVALIESETISTSLSDAHRAVAGTFLTTDSSAKSALYQRYRQDLARATANLAKVSGQAGSDSAVTVPLRTLTSGIPAYSGVIETARANDRQGNPVGSAYLGEADNLLTSSLLPAADAVYAHQRVQLDKAYGSARRWPLAVVAGLLLVALIATLVVVQRMMSRRFRRTFNLPLLGATLALVVALMWFGGALVAQGSAIDKAESQGSDPISSLTQASILSQRLRSDDELTLVTRDTVPTYQADYDKVARQLDALLTQARGSGDSYQALRAATPLVNQLAALHRQIRSQDATQGNLTDAISLDAGGGVGHVPTVADHLETVLSSGTANTSQRFSSVASDARDDLSGLVVGLILLGVVAAGLALLGAQRRIEEYR